MRCFIVTVSYFAELDHLPRLFPTFRSFGRNLLVCVRSFVFSSSPRWVFCAVLLSFFVLQLWYHVFRLPTSVFPFVFRCVGFFSIQFAHFKLTVRSFVVGCSLCRVPFSSRLLPMSSLFHSVRLSSLALIK